jgi:hypothetical protein
MIGRTKKADPKRVRAGKKAARKRKGKVSIKTRQKISKSLKVSYKSGKAKATLEKKGIFRKDEEDDKFGDDLFSIT